MEQYSLAQEFVNLMAKALQILVSVSREDLYTLNAMKDYSAIGNDVKQKIDTPTIESAQQLLERIRSILSIAQSCTNPDRLLYAKALCQYLDQLISYSDDMCNSTGIWANNRIFLHCLVPVQSDRTPVMLKSLNSNYLETGVCISPKFPVSNAINTTSTPATPRSLVSQNALYGINGSLLNVSYRPYEKDSPEVQHIILSERICHKDELLPQETRIVFSPLTDRSNLKPYGTSVIWGNCCGAVCDDSPQMHTQRTIGGCSYAGIDCPNRFGTIANCNFHCGASSVCLFVVNIPTAVSQGKISPGSIPKIEHINN